VYLSPQKQKYARRRISSPDHPQEEGDIKTMPAKHTYMLNFTYEDGAKIKNKYDVGYLGLYVQPRKSAGLPNLVRLSLY
jgi:hypothetical protein